jgi:hypothetical protein
VAFHLARTLQVKVYALKFWARTELCPLFLLDGQWTRPESLGGPDWRRLRQGLSLGQHPKLQNECTTLGASVKVPLGRLHLAAVGRRILELQCQVIEVRGCHPHCVGQGRLRLRLREGLFRSEAEPSLLVIIHIKFLIEYCCESQMSRGSPRGLLFYGHLNKITVTVTRRDCVTY